jgi:multidrug transporter EmrE-like cation transporter
MSFPTIFVLLVSIITASTAQIFLKKGVSSLGDLSFSFSNVLYLIFNILRNGWLFGGMLLFVISFLFYLFVLSKLRLNFAYPVMVSVGIILVAIGSWFFLGEYLSWRQIIGVILIIFGIFLLFPKG